MTVVEGIGFIASSSAAITVAAVDFFIPSLQWRSWLKQTKQKVNNWSNIYWGTEFQQAWESYKRRLQVVNMFKIDYIRVLNC